VLEIILKKGVSMFSKESKPPLVGAKEKREKALKFDPRAQIKSKREGKETSPLVLAVMVYGVAAVLATLLTEGPFKDSGFGFQTGINLIDQYILAGGVPSVTGSPDTDLIILILLRGLALFLVAGVIPFATFISQKIFDKVSANVYFAFWGTTLSLGVIYYGAVALLPVIMEIIG
jgi:hypothetical protein